MGSKFRWEFTICMMSMIALSYGPAMEVPVKLANVPPFPSVAMKLVSLLSEENSNFANIAACIGSDPALAGRLIKRANAADLATYCKAGDVLQAVSVLGLERTRELSLAIVTSGYAQTALKTEILRPCWNHTLACALVASEIARHCGLRPAEAYTAGLLHDIGRLGLLTAFPAEYEAILVEAAGEPEELIRLERTHFGVDHLQSGEWLARQWNLPEPLVEVIARHAERPVKPIAQIGVVQIASRLADLLGFSVIQAKELPELNEIAAALPESVRAVLKGQFPALRERILRELRLLEGPETPAPAESQPVVDEPEAGAMGGKGPRLPVGPSGWLVIGAVGAAFALLGGVALFLLR